jgi:glycosyltransferase involved in cell wall biosynthesis
VTARISVVVPTFNQGRFLAQCLASIVGQGYPNLELIVMDGGSTDSTADVIRRFSGAIRYHRSAPDGGQAQAINEGFRHASGDILTWLNSDDMYMPETFQRVAAEFPDLQQPDLLYGGCLHFSEDGAASRMYRAAPFDALQLTYYDYIVQPSAFWTRRLWEMAGPLDETLHYVLDWDWFIRASRLTPFRPLRDVLSIYRLHESQKTLSGGDRRAREVLRVVEKYAPPDMISAYRDVYEHLPGLQRAARFIKNLHLYRLDRLVLPRLWWRLAFPRLSLRHRGHRIQTVLSML